MNDAVQALFARTTQGIKPGLEIIDALLQALDNPHRRLAVIHVAGTNGKGSVCAMLEAVLRASGFKTGLYTSPHLIDFAERFRINGAMISEEKLAEYIQLLEKTADQVAEENGQRPATFFEISTALAFQYFADESVDIAIIETGMGGRWDATNVVIPLLSVITHIDIDHTNFLGNCIEDIAAEKAGIIKPGRPVISAPQSATVIAELHKKGMPIISSLEAVSVQNVDAGDLSFLKNRVAASRVATEELNVRNAAGSRIYNKAVQRLKIETHARNLPPINLPLLGECQRENCAVAVAALEIIGDLLDFEPEFKKGLESVEWGGRFQILTSAPLVILDGAHNPSAGRALAKTLKEVYPRYRIGFIFGFLNDKDSVEFLREIKGLSAAAWTIPIDAPRGRTAEDAASQALLAGIQATPSPVTTAWAAAREWAGEADNRLVVLTGSLYLKQVLKKAGCA